MVLFHPSKQNLSAEVEKENKEDVYSRVRDLADGINELPAVKDVPGYLEVPLKAKLPWYVLFDQSPTARPRNEKDIYESDEEGSAEGEGGRHNHLWIPAELSSRDEGSCLSRWMLNIMQ